MPIANSTMLALGALVTSLAALLTAMRRSGWRPRFLASKAAEDPVPNAPAPVYNNRGRHVPAWTMRLHFDPAKDIVVMSYEVEETPNQQRRAGASSWQADDTDAIADAVILRIASLNVPRLF